MSSNHAGAAGPIEEELDETGRASSSQPHHSKSQESNLDGMRVKSVTTTKDAGGEAGGRDLYDYELYIQMEEREEEDGKRRQREERD